MEVIERKENPFPEDLEGRLNAMLNVVNTEFKSVTLLHLDDSPVEASEIKARIKETVGREVYLPRKDVFGDYCHHTFLPIGTVAEEIIRRQSVEAVYPAWRLTETGKKYGRPIACLALQFSVSEIRSMHDILGSTLSSGKTRSPLNRTRILEVLSENEDTTESNLSKETGLDAEVIRRSLKELEEIGFVNFNSIEEIQRGKGIIEYRWIEGKNPRDVKRVAYGRRALTKKMAKVLSERKKLTPVDCAKVLNYNYSGDVNSVLSHLIRQGFVKRAGNLFGGERYSEARITNKAGSFLEFVKRAEEILSDRLPDKEMREIYLSFVDRRNYGEILRSALELYRKVSPSVNKRPKEETNERIIEFLRKAEGARCCEVAKYLGSYSPTIYLTPLVKSGILRKEKKGRETRYYIT